MIAQLNFIVGEYLWAKSRQPLFKLAKHKDIWHRRVAIVGSFGFIKKGDPSTTLALAEILLQDPHDLIQKATGWMLREVGKKVDRKVLLEFLDKHAANMPRTMLSYAIEHLNLEQKLHYRSQKKA